MAALELAPVESCGHPPHDSTRLGLTYVGYVAVWSSPHREVGPRAGAHVLTQSCGLRFKPLLRDTCAP
jgi:hypothetical protein